MGKGIALQFRQAFPLNYEKCRKACDIESAFATIPEVRTLLYSPEGAPSVEAMPIATRRPGMTRIRAALIGLFRKYIVPGYRLTLLEAQKLAYFLDAAGEELRLGFKRGQ